MDIGTTTKITVRPEFPAVQPVQEPKWASPDGAPLPDWLDPNKRVAPIKEPVREPVTV